MVNVNEMDYNQSNEWDENGQNEWDGLWYIKWMRWKWLSKYVTADTWCIVLSYF